MAEFAGLYEVSNLGRVRRVGAYLSTYVGRVLTPHPSNRGYWRVTLCRPGDRRKPKYALHQLVAEAFIGQPPPGLQVNHKDTDKSNNRADNLEYCTQSENNYHASRMGIAYRGDLAATAKLTDELVREIRGRYAEGGIGHKRLAKEYGVAGSTMWAVVSGATWKHVV